MHQPPSQLSTVDGTPPRRSQMPCKNGGSYNVVKIRLDNMYFAAIDRVHGMLIDVNADYLLLSRSQHCGRRQPDIAQPDN
jgi:hypothetical protein